MKNKPKLYTLSAILLGYAMLGDYNANEQNALGNWFMLLGQVLETNSAMLQLLNNTNRFGNNININEKPSKEEIDSIREVLNNLLDKLNKL